MAIVKKKPLALKQAEKILKDANKEDPIMEDIREGIREGLERSRPDFGCPM